MDDVDPSGTGTEGEGLLAQVSPLQRDQRVAALQDERVHHVAHGFAARTSSASHRSVVTVLAYACPLR
jgi:hypothetical protein